MSSSIGSIGGSDTKVIVNSILPAKQLNISGAGVSIIDNPSNGTYDITIAGGSGGEVNTTSTLGTGAAWTLAKSGFNLPFRSFIMGSNKLALTTNTNDLTIDVTEANLTLANLGGTLAYNKLVLTTSIVNNDIATAAAIAYSKLGTNLKFAETGLTTPRTFTLPDASGALVIGTDSRLSDARSPTAHATTHNAGGSDLVSIDTIGAGTDITTNNVSITKHGLAPKGSGVSTQYLDGTGAYSTPLGTGGEANTTSTVGTGAAWTLPKSGVNLPFRSFIMGSSKLALTTNANDLTIDVTEANLTLGNLGGTLGKAKLPGTTVYTDQTNTYGAFAQIYPNTQLKIQNPAATFNYIVNSSAITTADKNVTLPLLTADDTFVFRADTATLTNKTMSGASNTFSSIPKGAIPGTTVYTDQANLFGAFTQTFPTSQLLIQNPAATFSYIIVASAIAANRNATLPLLTGNDQFTMDAFATTLTNKTMSGSSNTFSNIPKGAIPGTTVFTDQSNTYGAFAQIFPTSQLKIQNPAATFNYIVAASAIAADRTLTLPLLTGNDQVTTDAFATTLTNKTVNASNNTINDTSIATGDILKSNGTKFVRFAMGTANQVLSVNAGGTDLIWAASAGGGFTEAKGSNTQSGNASTTAFTIAHTLAGTPTYVSVVPKSNDADDDFYVTVDATNITITYPFAPPNVASNLSWWWRATL